MQKEKNTKSEIVIYQNKNKDVATEALVKDETIWLTQEQIAVLFGVQRPAITKHLLNIFKTSELSENSVCSILEHTAEDGKVYKVKYYNLDAILSVGYRVNSKRATDFRIWATSILRSHILQGYSLNQKKILELRGNKLEEFEQAVVLIKKTIDTKQLSAGESEGVLRVITEYANTWVLLQKYDKQLLSAPGKTRVSKYRFSADEARVLVCELKDSLVEKKEASELFGLEQGGRFLSVIGNIYQSFGKQELYHSIEEKAANLLYLIIKDHPFSDGNKRIASFLFVIFLVRNSYLLKKNGEKKINDNALVAMALLIAESNPKQKDILIKLVMNFLAE